MELQEELRSRKLYDDVSNNKDSMMKSLKKELRGVQRVPSLIYQNPKKEALINNNIADYEMCSVEPMHDIAGHIKNVLTEFPNHLDKPEKECFEKAYNVSFGSKENNRACDYRRGLIELTFAIKDEISDYETLEILLTLIEIQRILYSDADERTPRQILQFHNMTFKHFHLIKSIFKDNFVSLTRRKFYGKYFHNLMIHAPIQYRIISGSSINCEDEERIFNMIKSITGSTSSRHPGHIIGNLILRYQAERKINAERPRKSYENDISKKYECLKEISLRNKNTYITKNFIKKNEKSWLCHLERLSDFIYYGEGTWWAKDDYGIEFFDGYENTNFRPEGPKLYHFRSSSQKDIQELLNIHWEKCNQERVTLPLVTHNENKMKSTEVVTTHHDDIKESSTETKADQDIDHQELVYFVNEEQEIEEEIKINDDNLNSESGTNTSSILAVSLNSSPNISPQNKVQDEPHKDKEPNAYDIVNYGNETKKENITKESLKMNVSTPSLNKTQKEVQVHSTPKSCKSTKLSFETTLTPIINSNKKTFKTKEATILYKVLGNEKLLFKLDKAKILLKKQQNKLNRDNYLDQLTKIQVLALQKETEIQEKIKKWEILFTIDNNFSTPTNSDKIGNETMKQLLKHTKIIKALEKNLELASLNTRKFQQLVFLFMPVS